MKVTKLLYFLSCVGIASVSQAQTSGPTDFITSTSGSAYAFPGVAEDLGPGESWYRSKAIHGSGVQKYGYDLTTIRFDKRANAWTRLKPGISKERYRANKTNQAFMVYNKPVYAMSDGKVVACWRNAPNNPAPGQSHPGRLSNPKTIYGGGNFLVVDIGNRQRILYAHFNPGSVPRSLCPNNKVFTADSRNKADQTLPASNQPVIKRGQFLGRVGNSGSSSGPHLHIHRYKGNQALTLPFDSFQYKSSDDPGDVLADWQRRTNSTLPPGKIAILPKFSKGLKEIARHGLPSAEYQGLFNQARSSGYQLEWIDGFSVGNKVFLNVIFRPSNGGSWVSYHNLTGAQYQQRFNQQKAAGRGLYQVESYRVGNSIRYAAIFRSGQGQTRAYHGLTAQQHQQRFEQYSASGWRAKNVSVTSIQGVRRYAALYTKSGYGSIFVKSFLSSAQYQQQFDANIAAGRQLSYLNAYIHNGKPRFTAIWRSGISGAYRAKHGMSGSSYQSNWNDALGDGFLTRYVTGYAAGSSAKYAALWRK